MRKSQKPRILAKQINPEARAAFKQQIDTVKDPFFESERVLIADNAQTIWDILKHVQASKDVFVTKDNNDFAPVLPDTINFEYLTPQEITIPRERPYALDREGKLRDLDIEVRQEYKNGKTTQTTKIGKAGNDLDPTLNRWEQKSVLKAGYGFNVYAIGDKTAREEILKQLTSYPKLVLRIVTQRIRIAYHPEGNPDLEIEIALEPLHCGETFTGFTWQAHKLDLEIKNGPSQTDHVLRQSILAREEQRFMQIFSLKHQLTSSATPGFDAIMDDMKKPSHENTFSQMGVADQWWKNGSRLAGLKVA